MNTKISGTKDIHIKGARIHNLKNVSVRIPRNQFIVITGVSGSGKSSLAIDTLFAEGQRKYAESLSSYARQFLNRMNKPDVDHIQGLCPAIAIEQKVITRTPRSTVGSMTEIYDYLRLLFARIGKTFSPVSGREVRKQDVSSVNAWINQLPHNSKLHLLAAFPEHTHRDWKEELAILMQKGFSRVYIIPKTTKKIKSRNTSHRRIAGRHFITKNFFTGKQSLHSDRPLCNTRMGRRRFTQNGRQY